jgi:hypothetical protein
MCRRRHPRITRLAVGGPEPRADQIYGMLSSRAYLVLSLLYRAVRAIIGQRPGQAAACYSTFRPDPSTVEPLNLARPHKQSTTIRSINHFESLCIVQQSRATAWRRSHSSCIAPSSPSTPALHPSSSPRRKSDAFGIPLNFEGVLGR